MTRHKAPEKQSVTVETSVWSTLEGDRENTPMWLNYAVGNQDLDDGTRITAGFIIQTGDVLIRHPDRRVVVKMQDLVNATFADIIREHLRDGTACGAEPLKEAS